MSIIDDNLTLEKIYYPRREGEEFDLLRAAALLPRVEGRTVDLDRVVQQVEDIANSINERLPEPEWPLSVVALIMTMFREMEFTGDEDSYDDPQNSFLDTVLRRRKGLPIALSVLTCEVAARIGVWAHGLALPGHFLVCIRRRRDPSCTEIVVVDPFHGGKMLGSKEIEEEITKRSGKPVKLTLEHFHAATPSSILFRMLNNLRGSYARRSAHEPLVRTLSRMLLLRPFDAALLAERAHAKYMLLDHDGALEDANQAIEDGAADDSLALANAVIHKIEEAYRFAN